MNHRRPFALPAAAVLFLSIPAFPVAAPGQDAGPSRTAPANGLISSERGVAQEWEFHRRSTSSNYRPTYNSMFDVNFSYYGYCPSRPYFLSRCATCGNYSAISASRR